MATPKITRKGPSFLQRPDEFDQQPAERVPVGSRLYLPDQAGQPFWTMVRLDTGKVDPPTVQDWVFEGFGLGVPMMVAGYRTTNTTAEVVAGQFRIPDQLCYVGLPLELVVVLSATNGRTGRVRLKNLWTGNFVEIGGPGTDNLNTTSATPVELASADLLTAAEFEPNALYELELRVSNVDSAVVLGSAFLRFNTP